MQNHIGENIRFYRARRGFTQEYLGTKVGLSDSAVSRIENGERAPTSKELEAVAAALDVSMEDLLRQPGGAVFIESPNSIQHNSGNNFHGNSDPKLLEENEKLRLITAHLEDKVKLLEEQLELYRRLAGKAPGPENPS